MSEKIDSRVLKTDLVEWRNLKFIQQEDFKEWFPSGDEKLLKSLTKYQFIDPFKVWELDGEIYCLDGKHRYNDLLEASMRYGIKIPDKLPATFIDCKDKTEAAEMVLVYSSAYARITQTGLEGFAELNNIDIDSLDSINLISETLKPIEDIPFPDELTADIKDAPPTLKITFKDSKQLKRFQKSLPIWLEENNYDDVSYSVSQGEL